MLIAPCASRFSPFQFPAGAEQDGFPGLLDLQHFGHVALSLLAALGVADQGREQRPLECLTVRTVLWADPVLPGNAGFEFQDQFQPGHVQARQLFLLERRASGRLRSRIPAANRSGLRYRNGSGRAPPHARAVTDPMHVAVPGEFGLQLVSEEAFGRPMNHILSVVAPPRQLLTLGKDFRTIKTTGSTTGQRGVVLNGNFERTWLAPGKPVRVR